MRREKDGDSVCRGGCMGVAECKRGEGRYVQRLCVCVCVWGAHVVCRSGLQEKASVGCPPGSSQTIALAVLSPPRLRVFACMLPVPQTFSIRPGDFRLRWLSPKSSRAWNGEGWEELSWGPGFLELNKGQERLEGG